MISGKTWSPRLRNAYSVKSGRKNCKDILVPSSYHPIINSMVCHFDDQAYGYTVTVSRREGSPSRRIEMDEMDAILALSKIRLIAVRTRLETSLPKYQRPRSMPELQTHPSILKKEVSGTCYYG